MSKSLDSQVVTSIKGTIFHAILEYLMSTVVTGNEKEKGKGTKVPY